MRQPGELFRAVADAVQRVRRATCRALYRLLTRRGLQTTAEALRKTIVNMVRLGHLRVAETVRVHWSRRPLNVYALPVASAEAAANPLNAVMACWSRQAA